MIKPFSYIVLLAIFFSCSTDFPIRKFDGTTVLNYGPASKIKHYYNHRNLGENLEISIRPEKESYYPLEEMYIILTVSNTSKTDSIRLYNPNSEVLFVDEAGKKFDNWPFSSEWYGSYRRPVPGPKSDIMGRPVDNITFPSNVLPPGESIKKRLGVKLTPGNRLFDELGSKVIGFPSLVPVGDYYPQFEHPHREFASDRLPLNTKIPLSNALPLRVVEPTGKAKEKADCIVIMAETINALGGLIMRKEDATLEKLIVLRNECEQILQMEPVILYADLVKSIYDVLDERIEFVKESKE